jgi:hypothetical protein
VGLETLHMGASKVLLLSFACSLCHGQAVVALHFRRGTGIDEPLCPRNASNV